MNMKILERVAKKGVNSGCGSGRLQGRQRSGQQLPDGPVDVDAHNIVFVGAGSL
jgi:hypothetical protein